MNYYMVIDFLVIFWLRIFCVSEVNIACRHVEEMSPVVIDILWVTFDSNDSLVVYENTSLIMICIIPFFCKLTNSKWVLQNKENSEPPYKIEVHQGTALAQRNLVPKIGEWEVIDVVTLKQEVCRYQVYVKPVENQCLSLSKDEINIFCTTKRVYPKAKCTFYISYNGQRAFEFENVIYSHKNETGYSVSNCNAIKPIQLTEIGTYRVEAIIYPNISNDKSDVVYGTNISTEIIFKSPYITLVNCPTHVKKYILIDCECVLNELGSTNVLYSWINASTNESISYSNHLRFAVDNYNTEFICKANSFKIDNVLYENYNIFLLSGPDTTE
ncbi:uncharacterized protein LOC106073608 isoform X2 [Biomphalaria glabrata]|uniref:Uncharacterized protein LOC106073608 isoform X2 n=1 Tax=Biomphalaria glabrata TaxID=6526 RepID=A0A9W2YWC5_BIOGL|nr:uncharacterized protein LOC106073608 isoform X2 [Biomphalaria glabrata]